MDFTNPLLFPDIDSLLAAVLNVFVIVATPIVVFFLIFAGFLYVTARGNPEKLKEASQALLYGIIGGVVIVGSVAITAIIKSVVNSF